MARPSEYDFNLCEDICDELADGKNIQEILGSNEDYPTWSTFRRWKNNNEELRTLYVSSQQDKGISLEEQIDEVMEGLKINKYDHSTANVLIQTLKWKMAKFYPKVFGDKQEIEQTGSVNITWSEEKSYNE